MRRPLIVVSLLLGAAACDPEKGTGVQSTVINVLVRDDRGVPVDRMPIMAASSSSSVDASTNNEGVAQLRVPVAGTYLVRVIARAGYIGSTPSLSRSVVVEPNAAASVNFTVHREGLPMEDPFRIPIDR